MIPFTAVANLFYNKALMSLWIPVLNVHLLLGPVPLEYDQYLAIYTPSTFQQQWQ
jgi:hypothetical protein